jgi:hypothetical protein
VAPGAAVAAVAVDVGLPLAGQLAFHQEREAALEARDLAPLRLHLLAARAPPLEPAALGDQPPEPIDQAGDFPARATLTCHATEAGSRLRDLQWGHPASDRAVNRTSARPTSPPLSPPALVQALQRLDEAEPAHEPLVRATLAAKPSADRLAIEMHVEPDAQRAVLVAAVRLVH